MNHQSLILEKLEFELTNDQKKCLNEINNDLKSNQKMFRLLQGDVGSGKTIVALTAAYNVVKSGFQVAVMAPTEILANQHYKLANKIFNKNLNIEILSSKSNYKTKKMITKKLNENKIDIIFGTHAIFQSKIIFKKLGLIIIDEQHKFGVNQRKNYLIKVEISDILLMSATPIPEHLL